MSNNLPTYRIVPEDLPDLDKKVRDGLEPMIDNLNRVLGAVVPAVNGLASVDYRDVTFTTRGSIADTFPLTVNTIIPTPRSVTVGRVQCPVTTDTSAGITCNQWVQLNNGALSIQVISGLVANTRYTITLTIQ